MSVYERYVLPRLIDLACGMKPVREQRSKLVPLASGRVLEIGSGSGLNFPYYDPLRVETVWALEPSAQMCRLARRRLPCAGFGVEQLEADAQAIPLDGATADSVVVTYALCTIPQPQEALKEIRRVLKPGGRLLFCEHGAAPDAAVRRWQDRLNPLWRRIAGGCNLNRPVSVLVERAGFALDSLETLYIPGWKPASFTYRGVATPA